MEELQDHDCGAMMLLKRRVRKTKIKTKTKQNKEQQVSGSDLQKENLSSVTYPILCKGKGVQNNVKDLS